MSAHTLNGIPYTLDEVAAELATVLAHIVLHHGDQIRTDLLAEARAVLDAYRETPTTLDSDGTTP